MVSTNSLLLLLSTLPSLAMAGTPDNVSSKLMVHVPHKLFKEGGYDHREALFGRPPYGGSISQNVYYTESDLCDLSKAIYKSHPKEVNAKGELVLNPPFILMVDRGDCAFVQKVRNAQRHGAAAVVIADNTCLCSDQECLSQQTDENGRQPACETAEPVMADDGSGADVSIPSFLMFKHDADKIKEELMANRPVRLEMQWSLPHPDSRVEYDLFTSPTDPVAHQFLSEFKPVALALREHAYFTPHMYVFDGVRSQCHGMNGENQCFNLCSNNGRYCAMDPDKNLDQGVSGYDVVKESLRRHCIWSNYGEHDGIGQRWWDYIHEFDHRCGKMEFFNSQDCVEDAYKHAKIDGDMIEQCMENSGGLDSDVNNSFLEAELKAQTDFGVVIMPTTFVNKVAIRGSMTVSNIFQAICAGFAHGAEPHVCNMCSHCGDVSSCVRRGHCTASMGGAYHLDAAPEGTVSSGSFYSWMFFIVVAFSVLGAWHYKKTRDDMREQVRSILADYMPLTDSEEGGTARSIHMQSAVHGMMGMSSSPGVQYSSPSPMM